MKLFINGYDQLFNCYSDINKAMAEDFEVQKLARAEEETHKEKQR